MNANCCEHDCHAPDADDRYRRNLWAALGANLAMFVIEMFASFAAGSMSLRADALDFLGDAANYIVALSVIGLSLQWRAGSALLKGAVMGSFGIWVAVSTVLHAIAGTLPKAELMGMIGLLALAINLAVAALLYRHRQGDSQSMSVWLCTRNDCIANISVILAGAGVWVTGTPWPDIAVAAIVAGLAVSSALSVIRRAMGEIRGTHAFHGAPAE